MYPVIRMLKEVITQRRSEELPLFGTHVSHHRCWPWDIDIWMELNNGRTLTLYDLGRIPLANRAGLIKMLQKERWGLTMAGASIRWRARIKAFERIEMRSRCVGWDERFIYLVQSMWKQDGTCANQIVYRAAVTDKNGIVSTDRVVAALGSKVETKELPEWVKAWIEADAKRPWPPENGDLM